MPRTKGQPHKIDISGNRYGRWVVIDRVKGSTWLCRCDCGTVKRVQGSSLKLGKTVSCGCYSIERTKTHGKEGTPTYNTWAHMLTRCRNQRHKQYAEYGGRGISVCEAWHSFENFYNDMGEKPKGMSLDRIDNDGNYEPLNCRWATVKQQIRNRRISPKYEIDGMMRSLGDLAEKYRIPVRRLYERMRSGWSLEDALSKPIRKKAKAV